MKKILFALLLTPLFGICQTNELANWPLSQNDKVTAINDKVTINGPKLTGLSLSEQIPYNDTQGMRVAADGGGNGSAWLPGRPYLDALKENRYIEFTISPKSGYKANVQTIKFNAATHGSSAGKIGIRYSKNADFSEPSEVTDILVPKGTAYAPTEGTFKTPIVVANIPSTASNGATLWNFKLNGDAGKSLKDGETLYVRVYLHNHIGGGVNKFIFLRNLSFTGELVEKNKDFENPTAEAVTGKKKKTKEKAN